MYIACLYQRALYEIHNSIRDWIWFVRPNKKPTECPGSEILSPTPQEYITHVIFDFAYPSLVLFFHPSLNMLLYKDILTGKIPSILIYTTAD